MSEKEINYEIDNCITDLDTLKVLDKRAMEDLENNTHKIEQQEVLTIIREFIRLKNDYNKEKEKNKFINEVKAIGTDDVVNVVLTKSQYEYLLERATNEFNKEKEKNKLLIEGKFREVADKNSYIKDNYISKDKIREYLNKMEKRCDKPKFSVMKKEIEELLQEGDK